MPHPQSCLYTGQPHPNPDFIPSPTASNNAARCKLDNLNANAGYLAVQEEFISLGGHICLLVFVFFIWRVKVSKKKHWLVKIDSPLPLDIEFMLIDGNFTHTQDTTYDLVSFSMIYV